MNIKQALKKKNILIEKIRQEYSRATTYNSIAEGDTRPYSSVECLKNYFNLTEELVTLKTSIHKANQPVYDKIFKLSEYKSIAKMLKALNCESGKIVNRWDSDSKTIMEVEIGVVERDKMVEEYEIKINNLQDELDYFNQTTQLPE